MLKLTIARSDAPRPPKPGSNDPGVRLWCGFDGNIYCHGYTLNGDHWLHLQHVASYCFSPGSDVVTAFPEVAVLRDLVSDGFYRFVLPIALQALKREWEVLHASGVRMPQGVVAFCGTSTMGKSTLAYGLSQRGYPLWADDNVVLQTSGQSISVIHLPTYKVRLRPASAAFFGLTPTGERTTVEMEGSQQIPVPQAPLAALCVLKRDLEASHGEAVSIRRLLSSQAFTAVLDHALCFSLHDTNRKRLMMQHYLDLVARTPVFEVRFQEGMERLPIILNGIEEALNSEPTDLSSLWQEGKKDHLTSGALAIHGLA